MAASPPSLSSDTSPIALSLHVQHGEVPLGASTEGKVGDASDEREIGTPSSYIRSS